MLILTTTALDITLDQFFIFIFILFYLSYFGACDLVSIVCLWLQEVNLRA